MSYLEIVYGGISYRLRGRSVEEIQQQIAVIVASGNPGWIEAYDSGAAKTPFLLLITLGVPLALAPVPST